MTPTPHHQTNPPTQPTPDHQTTPETETSPPTEDQQDTTKIKITKPNRPMHHDPTEINFSVADAPSQWILPTLGGAAC